MKILVVCFIICIYLAGYSFGQRNITSRINESRKIFEHLQSNSSLREKITKIKKPTDFKQIVQWKADCRENHGEEVLKNIEAAPGKLIECILQYVKPSKLQVEVNKSIETGNLDLLFKKYCGYRPKIMACLDSMLDTFRTCMTAQQQEDIVVVRRSLDAGIDFTCHDDGDRIALFMAEGGIPCLRDHEKEIKECIEERVPQIKEATNNTDIIGLDQIVINDEQCRKLLHMRDCVQKYTGLCEDPTPANVLDSLIAAMLAVTPCKDVKFEPIKSILSESSEQRAAMDEPQSSSAASLHCSLPSKAFLSSFFVYFNLVPSYLNAISIRLLNNSNYVFSLLCIMAGMLRFLLIGIISPVVALLLTLKMFIFDMGYQCVTFLSGVADHLCPVVMDTMSNWCSVFAYYFLSKFSVASVLVIVLSALIAAHIVI